MDYRRNKWTKHADFIILDLVCMELALLCANAVRFSGNFFDRAYGELAFVSALLFICLIFFTEPYADVLRRGYLMELRSVLLTDGLLAGLLSAYLFITRRSAAYSRIMAVLFIVFSMCFMYTGRVLWKQWVKRRTRRPGRAVSLVLVAKADGADECVRRMLQAPFREAEISGIVLLDTDPPNEPANGNGPANEEPAPAEAIRQNDRAQTGWGKEAAAGLEAEATEPKREERINGIPVVGREEDLIDYCRGHVVDDVLFYDCKEKRSQYMEALAEMGICVHMNLAQAEEDCRKYRVSSINGLMALSSSPVRQSEWGRLAKRLMDIAGGLAGSLATLLLLPAVAPVIRIQSPGPVFFRQTRVGKNGRKFTMYKFRSMSTDAEEKKKALMGENKMQGLMFKMEHDPRVYPFGRFLRRTSLDEFPQFFNVLKGEMSLVGTRPPTEDEYLQYEPRHKGRLAMKPGITGLWQVSGRSNVTDFEEVVRLDNQYIQNWSLGLDIKILFKTVAALFQRKGAV